MYNNIKTYINPKGMIGMLITGRHVWDHAYGRDMFSTMEVLQTKWIIKVIWSSSLILTHLMHVVWRAPKLFDRLQYESKMKTTKE
jgi:hypothetical protein